LFHRIVIQRVGYFYTLSKPNFPKTAFSTAIIDLGGTDFNALIVNNLPLKREKWRKRIAIN
jgi:hypothetical protein